MNKKHLQIISLVAVTLMFSLQTAIACTVYIQPFRKEFRQADSVFAGRIVKVEEINLTEIEKQKLVPKDWDGWNVFSKVTVEVNQKWKGNSRKGTKEFFAVAFFDCGCPDSKIDEFVVGQEYLIASPKNTFISICDSKNTNSDRAKAEIKQLDRFGFRLWARIYPF